MSYANRPLNRRDYKTLTLAARAARWSFMTLSFSFSSPPSSASSSFPQIFPNGCARCKLLAFSPPVTRRVRWGIIMAHFGDLVGRKKMFTLSILLMALPTLAIGLLPTYSSVGIIAPLLLLLMRILQERRSAVKFRAPGVCR